MPFLLPTDTGILPVPVAYQKNDHVPDLEHDHVPGLEHDHDLSFLGLGSKPVTIFSKFVKTWRGVLQKWAYGSSAADPADPEDEAETHPAEQNRP